MKNKNYLLEITTMNYRDFYQIFPFFFLQLFFFLIYNEQSKRCLFVIFSSKTRVMLTYLRNSNAIILVIIIVNYFFDEKVGKLLYINRTELWLTLTFLPIFVWHYFVNLKIVWPKISHLNPTEPQQLFKKDEKTIWN